MYLLETEVVLELRRAKSGRTDPGLAAWAQGVARQDLYISALHLLELESAVARAGVRERGGAAPLRAWLDDQVRPAFEGRILSVTAAIVRRRAQLAYPEHRDGLVAATALEHGLTLVSRNPAAFRAGKVKVFNPWGYRPPEEDADWRQAARAGPLWLRSLFVRG